MSRLETCSFCKPKENPHFAQFGVCDLSNRILFESENIYVTPDVLPSHPDGLHLLMIPKPHRYSFAENPDLAEEVGYTLGQLERRFCTELVFFEHGSVKDGGKNQSIYHQHAHLIDAEGYDVIRYMSEYLNSIPDYLGGPIHHKVVHVADRSPIVNLQTLFDGVGYLYMQQGYGAIIAHDGVDGFPSQLTQRGMSRFFGQEVNWKKLPHNEQMTRLSVQRLIRLMDRCRELGINP
jgi:diadenosine tetraphosphate (Ap4A) HIT family hydrolase